MQSAVIDYNTGKMYWSAVYDDYTTGLLEVDLSTGRASHRSKNGPTATAIRPWTWSTACL